MAGRNILVVDDDSKTVNNIVEVLESEGYAVFSASDKETTIELSSKIKPSLIFVNAILSDASGLEITRAIRSLAEMKTVPIIMLTEMDEEFSDRYKSTYGIINFIKKPIESGELLSKVGQSLPDGPGEPASVPPLSEEDGASEWLQSHSQQEDDAGTLAYKSFEEAEHPDDEMDKTVVSGDGPAQKKEIRIEVKSKEDDFSEFMREQTDEMKSGELPLPDAGPQFELPDEMQFSDEPIEEDPGLQNRLSGSRKLLLVALISLGSVFILAGATYVVMHLFFNKEPVVTKSAMVEKAKPSPAPAVKPEAAPAAKPEPGPVHPAPQGALPSSVPAVSHPSAGEPPVPAAASSAETQKPGEKKIIDDTGMSHQPDGEGRYSVQTGYFSVGENASTLARDLKTSSYPSFVKEEKTANGTRYRVLVGRFPTPASASSTIKKLKAEKGMRGSVYKLPLTRSAVKETSDGKKGLSERAGKYSVAAGYFSMRANAESLAGDLKAKKYDAFVKKERTKYGLRYRVLVGSYRNPEEAASVIRKLKTEEKLDAGIYRL